MCTCRSTNIRCRNEWSALRNRNNNIMTSGCRVILGNIPDDPLPLYPPPPLPPPPSLLRATQCLCSKFASDGFINYECG